jgi:hypothetical protein
MADGSTAQTTYDSTQGSATGTSIYGIAKTGSGRCTQCSTT